MPAIPPSSALGFDLGARSEPPRSIPLSAERQKALWTALAGGDIAAGDTLAVMLVEGWRGEICHVALTDRTGKFRRYKIVDASFHNWTGLELAMRGQAISDFPICNKSFNLSYCGFDL